MVLLISGLLCYGVIEKEGRFWVEGAHKFVQILGINFGFGNMVPHFGRSLSRDDLRLHVLNHILRVHHVVTIFEALA